MVWLAIGAMIGSVPGIALADAAETQQMQVSPASAEEGLELLPAASRGSGRDYGPARPGMGTPASTMDPGRVSIEVALADWQRDDQPGVRADTLLAASTTIRVGVADTTEIFASWSPYGHVRVRDTVTDEIAQANRVGDVALGLKKNLRSPDGSGFAIAAQPFVVLPVGRAPIGAGDWGAGVVLPASYDLSQSVNLQLTPEIDAATNSGGRGRHLAYSLVCGLGLKVTKALQATGELSAQRDMDPDGHATRLLGGVSLGWRVSDNLQLDIGGTVGFNHQTPDHRIYTGISRRI